MTLSRHFLGPWLIVSRCLLVGLLVGAIASASAGAEGQIQRFTVSRDDTHHQGWPSVCIASNGDLVCSYAEADTHGGGSRPRALVCISKDEGRTWSKPIVVDTVVRASPFGRGFMQCRWILRLKDGSLLLGCDFNGTSPLNPPGSVHNFPADPVNTGDAGAWLYRSRDNGRTWTGPQKTYCLTVSLTMQQLSNGTIILAGSHYHTKGDYWSQVIYYSKDNAKTWYGPVVVLDDPKYSCGEGHVVEMPGGKLVMYLRNIAGSKGAFKMISDDGGMSWQGPYAAGYFTPIGRITAGVLSSGDVLVMHRVNGPANKGEALGFFVETPAAALSRIPYDPATYRPTAKSWGIIDIDTNKEHVDAGYCGWVELPDGDIYAVQYITADAPRGKPFIRGYRIPRSFLTRQPRNR
ncbi:MAG: exo-alpha-sialidase [Planctomycetes bacterium]|nr:exo-alpha-sialidase [Planctomycetota bacterium]